MYASPCIADENEVLYCGEGGLLVLPGHHMPIYHHMHTVTLGRCGTEHNITCASESHTCASRSYVYICASDTRTLVYKYPQSSSQLPYTFIK